MAPYSRPYVHPLSQPVKPSPAPVATGGKRQPDSARGPKLPRTVRVKAHTRTVAPRAPRAPKPPANPDQALIEAAVRTRFGPQETAVNQQLQQNARYTAGLPGWYTNALDEIRHLQSGGQTQTQQTLGQLGQYNSQAVLADPTDQQAANARNNLNAEFAAQQGQIGQANSGALDRLMAAFVIQQGNTQNQANRDRSLLLGQQGQLKGQEGDFRTTYGAQLAQQEQTQRFKETQTAMANAIAQGRLDVAQQLANQLGRHQSAGESVARTNARTTRARVQEQTRNDAAGRALARQRLSLDQWKATHPNSGRGAGANSTYSKAKIQGFRQNWDYAQATAHQLRGKGTYTDKQGKRQNISVDVAYSALLNATKDPDIARAAALTAFGKPIPAGLRHRLAIKGVHAADPPVGRTPGGGPYGTGRIP